MGLAESFVELLAPTRCAGCDHPRTLLCDECLTRAVRFDAAESCPRCAAPFGALVCTECWERHFAFEAACSLGELSDPLGRAVVLYKDAHERRLGAVLGGRLGERVAARWPGWAEAVTWIPASNGAMARRGFDHARELAAAVALALNAETQPLLARGDAADQRSLGRLARAANVSATFVAARRPPARVLLVDDVFTTGSTLDAAACALLARGCREVRVAVVARAW